MVANKGLNNAVIPNAVRNLPGSSTNVGQMLRYRSA